MAKMNKDRYERLRPFFPVLKMYHNSRVFAGGDLSEADKVNQELGGRRTDMWCPDCVGRLLDDLYDKIIRYDRETFNWME